MADANRADSALSTFALTGSGEALNDRALAVDRLHHTLGSLRRVMADDAGEVAFVTELDRLYLQLETAESQDLSLPTLAAQRAALRADALSRHRLLDRINTADVNLQALQAEKIRQEDASAARTGPVLILVLSLVFAGLAALFIRQSRRRTQQTAQQRRLQERFGEAMQLSDSQAEAHGLLKSHLERVIPGASVTVLNRNNSADRLEPSTSFDDGSALRERLEQARPRACMAVRLSRTFEQGADSEEVLSCELCSALDGQTSCHPLLVGGEVIGAVLTERQDGFPADDSARISQSVAQSAPVLANLRNLAVAEARAATDALTGLPNRRAVDENLLRLLAQAGRTFNPLSVILLDLDHFKLINDSYGHDRGDQVLAAFGAHLREALRTSDFAGRNGGEEFVIFLPNTDRVGAIRLAEKVRTTTRGLTIPGVERAITASFGIACFPDDAVDATGLMRCADRALYAAKRSGRDRIEASSTGAPTEDSSEQVSVATFSAAASSPG